MTGARVVITISQEQIWWRTIIADISLGHYRSVITDDDTVRTEAIFDLQPMH